MNLSGLLPVPQKDTTEPLHSGVYKVKAVAADTFISVNGHPYLRLQYSCPEGYSVEYLYVTETALKGTLRKLVLLGWKPEEDGWDISRIITDTVNTLPESVIIQVEDVDFEKKITPRVVSLVGGREKYAATLKFLSELKNDQELVKTISEGLTQKLSDLVNN